MLKSVAYSSGGGGGGGGTPAGPDTSVQYNAAGSFGGDAGFTYNPAADSFTLAGLATMGSIASGVAGLSDALTITNAAPRVMMINSGGGTDGKVWDEIVLSNVLTYRTRTDADGAGATWASVTRAAAGTSITGVAIGAGSSTLLLAGTGAIDTNSSLMRMGAGNSRLELSRLAFNSNTSASGLSFFRSTSSIVGLGGGSLAVADAGQGLRVAEGSNAKQGVATLAAGTVTVANTSVTANSRIFLTAQALGAVAVPAALCVSARVAGASFTILSSDVTDTSTVAYEIFEPS